MVVTVTATVTMDFVFKHRYVEQSTGTLRGAHGVGHFVLFLSFLSFQSSKIDTCTRRVLCNTRTETEDCSMYNVPPFFGDDLDNSRVVLYNGAWPERYRSLSKRRTRKRTGKRGRESAGLIS